VSWKFYNCIHLQLFSCCYCEVLFLIWLQQLLLPTVVLYIVYCFRVTLYTEILPVKARAKSIVAIEVP